MILTLPNITGEAWEFHGCRFAAEALLDNDFFSHHYFSSLLSDCTQVRWHLQPLPALGSEQTVERTGLRRVLPARSAPSHAAVPFHLGLPGFLCGEIEVAFSLPSLPWNPPQERAVEEILCLIWKVGRGERAATISLPSLLLYQHQAGGRALLCLSTWIQLESPRLDSSLRTLQSSLALLSWNGTRATLHQTLPLSTVFYLAFHAPTTAPMGALPSLFPKYDTFFCLQMQRKGSNALPSTLLKGPKQASQSLARTYCKCFQTPAESAVRQGFFWNTVITPFGSICIGKVMQCYNTGCSRV